MNMPLVLLNRRRRGNVFTPSGLFALAEPGVWYDPSDVANLNWRRNLLTWTEQFDNAVWAKVSATVSANAGVAPDGTSTADHYVPAAGSVSPEINRAVSDLTASTTYVNSVYLKDTGNGSGWFELTSLNPTVRSWFDIRNGIKGNGVGVIQSVGNGWYRCSVPTTVTSTSTTLYISPRSANGNSSAITATAVPYALIWGAQFELGSTATEYQRISDVNTEVIERFPSATLYQDTAGTTPVTTPGQTVALALDKSKGLVLGSNIVADSSFDASTAWSLNTGASITGGQLVFSSVGSTLGASQTIGSYVGGRTYQIIVDVASVTAGAFRIRLGGGGDLISGINAAGVYTRLVVGESSTQIVAILAAGTTSGIINSISVKELPGFHATQATAASRPTYGIVPRTGRRNLLTRTEEFDNAVWTKFGTLAFGSGSVANVTAAPDGTVTADLLTETSGASSVHQVFFSNIPASAATYVASFYLKPNGRNQVSPYIFSATGSGLVRATIDLSNGSVVSAAAVISGTNLTAGTATITPQANGFYRITLSATLASGSNIDLGVGGFNGAYSYAGDGTSGFYIWGAQLETGSSATAYQRVGSAFDVTEAGVASLSYLSFDGVDDFLVTPTIDPSTGPATGSELVSNGDFSDGTTGWTGGFNFGGNATFAAVGGVGRLSVTAAGPVSPRVVQTLTGLTVGNTYRISIQVVAASGSGDVFSAWTSVSNGTGGTTLFQATPVSAPGTRTFFVQASATTMYLALGRANSTSGAVLDLDNISVKVSAADKAQVFAGVRKLSDAAQGMVAELSTIASNPGSINIQAPGVSPAQFRLVSGGSLAGVSAPSVTSGHAAPVSRVMTGLADISGDVSTLRLNGAQVAQDTTDQGTGNYLAYPIYIGRRGGTTLPFNGNLFSLIVRFGANLDAGTITSTETWVAGKTGVTL